MNSTSETMLNDTSRREFFKQIVLGGMGLYLSPLLLQSCSEDDLGKPPFGVWKDMIKVLEQSPDHFIGRRNALVASKNPEAMTNFVRESFQIIPRQSDFLHQAAYGTIYGKQMALRCGLATPREKAEILKDMLVEAGYEAKVVLEETNITLDEAKAIVYQKIAPEFAPPISKKKMRKWQSMLGVTNTQGHYTEIPNFIENSEALATNLLNKIDKKYVRDVNVNFRFHNNAVPSVVFYEEGVEKYAHVFDPKVSFGNFHPTNKNKTFNEAGEYNDPLDEDITITLSCRKALDHWNETELLSGTWKLSELLGNQLQIQFLNNMSFEEQSVKTISEISSFTPCFALQDINKDTAYMEKRSVLGEPITLEGVKIFENYNPDSLPSNEETSAIKKIHSFEGTVMPQAFPKVRLELSPKDAQGNIIEGVSISNFEILDNDMHVTGWMNQNVLSPKVLLLYDTSASMPVEYAGEQIKLFLKNTEDAIKVAYPRAKVILQQTGSNIYTALLKAKQLDVDLILYATDGDNNDLFDPSYTPIYEAGPPAIFLNVKPQGTVYQYLRDNMDFIEISADNQELTITEITKIVEGLKFPTYVVTYNSFGENEDHKVEVKIKDTTHKVNLNYKFPEPSDSLLGNRMVGLYLTLNRLGRNPIRRVLAGYEPHNDYYGNPTKLTRKMVDQVHEMFLGGAVMAFEREAPTLSIQLTEYLQTLMSNQNWFEAYQNGDVKKAVEELGKGGLSYPSILLSMLQPIKNNVTEHAVTYPNGFRSCIVKFTPGYYNKETKTSFDFLPTSEYQSVSRIGTGNFEETLKKTAQLAILEGHVFPDSAYAQLKEKPLLLNREIGNDDQFSPGNLGNDGHYFGKQIFGGGPLKLFDTSWQVKSFWSIDTTKGELYGILPDQTGGGTRTTYEQLMELDKVVEGYKVILAKMKVGITVTGLGNLPIGLVATYSMTLVKLYALASQALILMNTTGMDEDLTLTLQALACDLYKEILYDSFRDVGTFGDTIENLIGAMGGDFSFFKC
ncbi:hypothetical protein EYD45_02165 [Hyunsoonleella flava]|uniref:Uncharacterized protein n=1 Tax=Hyunsoonleella flava TaxID=2527939 RepID=A0A4Q9FLU8_9FLAO|nr:hypothetical protein [Hyunsoonleella flava]TBN06710.1 hypothetical protein EYD45_02165 [Hyunsoonleella flava]